jgi:uncharacterized protein YdbL (DUF1318 family)
VNITRRSILAMIVALLLIPATALFGAESKKDQLRKRLRERAPEIAKLKADGVIGETDEGYVDFVKGKDKGAEVVDAENADRKAVYENIAKDTGESVEKVAKQAAQKQFDHAKPGEWLKVDGKWKKKG